MNPEPQSSEPQPYRPQWHEPQSSCPAAYPPPPEPVRRPLNRPARWVIAAIEVVAAAALVGLAVWAWRRSSVPFELPEFQNPAVPDTVTRTSGPWAAAAIGAGLVAGIALLDAVREVVLALRPPALREPPQDGRDDRDDGRPGGAGRDHGRTAAAGGG